MVCSRRWGPSETLRAQFSEDDSRREATFVEAYTVDADGEEDFYASAVRKYRGDVISGSRVFADDIVLYRYADVLLMIAEAKNELGMDPSQEIDAVRERAYGEAFSEYAFTSGSPAENAEAILEERLRDSPSKASAGGIWSVSTGPSIWCRRSPTARVSGICCPGPFPRA